MTEIACACGIDWLELAGGIDWSGVRPGVFEKLKQLKAQAQRAREPVEWELDDMSVFVDRCGIGKGHDSHKEYVLKWRDVTVAVSRRNYGGRKLHNFYVEVPGDTCVIVGAMEAWDAAWEIVGKLGGKVVDEWGRRLDLAVDVPGVSVRDELVPAVEERRFVTTFKDWKVYDGSEGKTGFHFGKRPFARLDCYDKKREVAKRSPDYRQAMIDRRWGGAEPAEAMRLEWQLGRPWFSAFGIDGLSEAVGMLPMIVAKLTLEEPWPMLRLTETDPDREHGNQRRAKTLPLWAEIGGVLQYWAGPKAVPVQRVNREKIDDVRCYQILRGLLTGFAARRGGICEGIADAHYWLDEWHRANGGNDSEWSDRWARKAKKNGTYDLLFQFPPADAA